MDKSWSNKYVTSTQLINSISFHIYYLSIFLSNEKSYIVTSSPFIFISFHDAFMIQPSICNIISTHKLNLIPYLLTLNLFIKWKIIYSYKFRPFIFISYQSIYRPNHGDQSFVTFMKILNKNYIYPTYLSYPNPNPFLKNYECYKSIEFIQIHP